MNPLYHIPAGLAVAGSFLLALVEPHLPAMGLLATFAGKYVGIEPTTLRFLPEMRPCFERRF